jgi:hypothetical protein
VLYCHLFFDEAFFEKSDLEQIESYLTLTVLNTLSILTQENINYQTHIEQYPQLVKDYQQLLEQKNLQLVKVVKKNDKQFKPLESIKQLISGFLILPAQAQYDHCSGSLSCKQWDYDCHCDDGTSCHYNLDECPEGICTDCTKTCGTTVELDPNWCERYGGDTCRSPSSGTCESISSIYCATTGVCYVDTPPPPPDATATPAPPPPPSCPNCCPEGMTCYGGRYADLDGDCAATEICCLECGYPPPEDIHARGDVLMWFFYDHNSNGIFDDGDTKIPNDIANSATLKLETLDRVNTDGTNYWTSVYDIGLWDDSYEGVCPTMAKIMDDCPHPDLVWSLETCEGENDEPSWENWYNCCGSSCGNTVCCPTDDNPNPGPYGSCQGKCEKEPDYSNRTGRWFWNGIVVNLFAQNLFWGSYDESRLTKVAWGGKIDNKSNWAPSGRVKYWLEGLPDDYEVTVFRYDREPMDANLQHIDNPGSNFIFQDIIYTRSSTTRTALFVMGIGPKIEPPQVQAIYSATESVCVANEGSTTINIEADYWDPETEPGFAKLLDNGNFEQENGWTLHAADPDGTYNPDPHDAGLTQTEKYLKDQSVFIYKGAETKWGPQINHSLPLLELSQTYTFSVWAKAPNSAQFILQQYPTAGCGDDYIPLASTSHPGNNEWKLLKFTYTPTDECARYAQIILSAGGSNVGDTVYFDGLAIEEGNQPGIFSDIKHFQVNIEAQPIETPMEYKSGYWPIRLMLNRMEHGGIAPNHFKIIHAPSGNFAYASIQFDSNFNRYYLAQDLTVQNSSGDNVATLLGSNPETLDWNTYFTLANDHIKANWAVKIESGFPSTDPVGLENFHISAHVRDFYSLEDSRTAAEVGDGRSTFYIPAFLATWHRLDTLNTIQPNIDFNIWEGDSCSSSPITPITVNNARIKLEDNFSSYFNDSSYSMTPDSCEGQYNVMLDLTNQTGTTYVCGCDNGLDGNFFTCEYFDVEATHETGNPINFFVIPADLSHGPWFQSVGGNILASGGDIRSYVPSDGSGPCDPTLGCEPALLTSLPWSSSNTDTPGFPLASGTVDTIDGTGEYSNIHNANRSQSDDGRAEKLTAQLPQRGYTYYYNKFGFNSETLSNNAMPTGLSTSDLNVYQYTGDLTIRDTNSWNVPNNVKLVVFVNGSLTFSGSNSNITSVDPGGFLAFIVRGEIIIDKSVGHSMSADVAEAASNTPNTATSNLEGVFIAQKITVESAGDSAIDNKLIAEGTFVGWNGITLARNFANEGGVGATHNMYNPTETFIHRPDLVINMPVEMKEALHEWREVNPSKE